MCADNLKCNSYDAKTLSFDAQYTVSYVKVVGQEASPRKCVLLGTSKNARKRVNAWRNANASWFSAVTSDMRGLGGHLDVTQRALAGTSYRVKEATSQVIAVGPSPWGVAERCSFCESPDGDGHLLWECPFPPLLPLSENPEFLHLWSHDHTKWPRCFPWHGWLPGLPPRTFDTPCAVAAGDLASHSVELALGACPLHDGSSMVP